MGFLQDGNSNWENKPCGLYSRGSSRWCMNNIREHGGMGGANLAKGRVCDQCIEIQNMNNTYDE